MLENGMGRLQSITVSVKYKKGQAKNKFKFWLSRVYFFFKDGPV
jgi:hypothetical protein